MILKIFLIFILFNFCDCELRLKKVIIFSRHNVRAPLFRDLFSLRLKKWQDWSVPSGQLTPRGALLETYMGEYFSNWLLKERLFNSRCPKKKSIYIYSNYLNRTIATARVFAKAAFPGCSIPVNSISSIGLTFPEKTPFPFLIPNMTEEFLESGAREMQRKLDEAELEDTYSILNNVIDIRNSVVCESDGYCDLTEGKDNVLFKVGNFPQVKGRFEIGKALVDSLMMSFYEGFSFEESVIRDREWKLLIKMLNENLRIGFKWKEMRVYTKPLLRYLKEASEDKKKFTLTVGHDTNLVLLMVCLGFKPYALTDQFEEIPIGSKLVFQKWSDGKNDFLKTEFVYQSWTQVREGEKLTLLNPPKNITLHFDLYEADGNGMYPWSLFKDTINKLI